MVSIKTRSRASESTTWIGGWLVPGTERGKGNIDPTVGRLADRISQSPSEDGPDTRNQLPSRVFVIVNVLQGEEKFVGPTERGPCK